MTISVELPQLQDHSADVPANTKVSGARFQRRIDQIIRRARDAERRAEVAEQKVRDQTQIIARCMGLIQRYRTLLGKGRMHG